jgi:hypothetical protein
MVRFLGEKWKCPVLLEKYYERPSLSSSEAGPTVTLVTGAPPRGLSLTPPYQEKESRKHDNLR